MIQTFASSDYISVDGKRFDVLKFILAIFVVGIHTLPINFWLRPLFRTAVPLFFFGSFLWRSDMNNQYYENIRMFPFIITGVLGTWVVYSLPWEKLGNGLLKFLNYAGSHTLQILTWHFLSFKIISLCIVLLYDLPIEHLAEFPVIESFSNQFWFLYFVTGVIVPLALTGFFNLLCVRMGILKTRA